MLDQKSTAFLGLDSPKKVLIFVGYILIWVLLYIYTHAVQSQGELNSRSVVLATAILKIMISIGMFVARETPSALCSGIWEHIGLMKWYVVPAALYALYDNLTFVNLAYFSPGVYIVMMQFRTLITAGFHQCIFKKIITAAKWEALIMMIYGCILYRLPDIAVSSKADSSINITMYLLLLTQMLASCFAGVYNEAMLKQKAAPLEIQNIYMYTNTALVNVAALLWGYGGEHTLQDAIMDINELFTLRVFPIVLILSSVGIVSSIFLKYLDSVRKTIAASMEIFIVALCSAIFFGESITINTIAGSLAVSYSAYRYSTGEQESSSDHSWKGYLLKGVGAALLLGLSYLWIYYQNGEV